ncbi:MAG: glycine--tRNA ligase subunit beta [Oxalobacteraceae bacterium]|jgi:glycyl-tRNA synthetase beta chain|nr:glycine--tRNA ligase subunit beta [Oxalobacteraceae bacterium]
MKQTLLVELLTEELPPKVLGKLGDAFATALFNGLSSRAFLDEGARFTAYASPRRLAVEIEGVRTASPDKHIREKVLPVSVALDKEGQPAAPLVKKLAALATLAGRDSIQLAELEQANDGKADSFFFTYTAPGQSLAEGLQPTLEESITKLPIPKVMSYQRPDGTTVQFVRPVHGLIALLNDTIIPLTLLGLQSSNTTLGHRFLSKESSIRIPGATSYADVLREQGRVIASYSERKEKIRSDLLAKANGDQILMPESLLDEVSALVEWPVVYECHFDPAFLSVPQECLILTMQTNQKYFALTDAHGKLRSRFLLVSNIETSDASHIIGGNERVIRPRLSDAKFFFEQDKKKKLIDRLPGLVSVVYHNKLGSQALRNDRVVAIAAAIAESLGADIAQAKRAAQLSKADLLTDMVGEFPELQGIMGTYYARHDGEPENIALAISEHYQPRFAGDALPVTQTGTVVALADKLETLIGIWGIGLAPTGDKDPFALRRHALGILRMLIEQRLPLSLSHLLMQTALQFKANAQFTDPVSDAQLFVYDRLRGLLRERGHAQDAIEAVVSQSPDRLDDILERLDAVKAFAALPEATSLAAANKRITNILKKNDAAYGEILSSLLVEPAEKRLYGAMVEARQAVDLAFAKGDFATTLKALASLRDDVDAFFNDVMVMAEDAALRTNRLALLNSLHAMMNRVADISRLAA